VNKGIEAVTGAVEGAIAFGQKHTPRAAGDVVMELPGLAMELPGTLGHRADAVADIAVARQRDREAGS
jgi:hypothetical protein